MSVQGYVRGYGFDLAKLKMATELPSKLTKQIDADLSSRLDAFQAEVNANPNGVKLAKILINTNLNNVLSIPGLKSGDFRTFFIKLKKEDRL